MQGQGRHGERRVGGADPAVACPPAFAPRPTRPEAGEQDEDEERRDESRATQHDGDRRERREDEDPDDGHGAGTRGPVSELEPGRDPRRCVRG